MHAATLALDTPTRRASTRSAAGSRLRPRARTRGRDDLADVHAFCDRLLYGGWLEDSRRDRIKLEMIRAIVEWARR